MKNHSQHAQVGPADALTLNNEIYHLLQRDGQNTLCGLRVSRVIRTERKEIETRAGVAGESHNL